MQIHAAPHALDLLSAQEAVPTPGTPTGLKGYSDCQDDSSTQGMFTPSPDEFGSNGEWSIEIDFETRGLKQSFSIILDEEAKVENALNAEWDKKQINEKEKKDSHSDTKGTRWDTKKTDTKACKEMHWEPRGKKIKVAPVHS